MATREEVRIAEDRMNRAKNELLAFISSGQHDPARKNQLLEELGGSMAQFLRLIRELVPQFPSNISLPQQVRQADSTCPITALAERALDSAAGLAVVIDADQDHRHRAVWVELESGLAVGARRFLNQKLGKRNSRRAEIQKAKRLMSKSRGPSDPKGRFRLLALAGIIDLHPERDCRPVATEQDS